MTIKRTEPPILKRVYPHVPVIADYATQQTTRLLWDRITDLEARLQGAEATIRQLTDQTNIQDDDIATAQRAADQALALAQVTRAERQAILEGSGALPAGGDGGEGAAGCGDADATTSHGTPATLSAREAGKIICGVGYEFPGLLDAAVDEPTRQAEAQEFVLRAIWHLQGAGFTAGRQRNPSGMISNDKLAVIVDGITRAYDVLQLNVYTAPMTTQMVEVAPPDLVADPGTPD